MSKNYYRKATKLLCPICGTELCITNQDEVKCLCLNKLAVIKYGKEKRLVPIGDASTARKSMQIKCKDCINFSQHKNSITGDCLYLEHMKRNISGSCIRICSKFERSDHDKLRKNNEM